MNSSDQAKVPDIVIRPAGPRDLEAVHRLSVVGLGSDAWSFEAFCREFEAPHVRLHLAEVLGSGVAAYALSWIVLDEATIVQVATSPLWRRRGFARALLRRVLEELHAAGARTCYLEVRRSRTAAIELYRGLGFRIDGMRRDYYRNPRDDALLMCLETRSIR